MGSSNSLFVSLLFLMFIFLYENQVQAAPNIFDVLKYGAIADGNTDNSKVFNDTWNQACQSTGDSVILIPSGTYLVQPIILVGPCQDAIVFQVEGVVKASTDEASRQVDHWFTFRYIDRLKITGGGSFDGQGPSAWPYNNCPKDPNCGPFPVTIRLDFINNSWINNITSINSKSFHFNIFACKEITIDHVTISAPEDSPNTDGIHIADSTGVYISVSEIGTGDDCISMGPGSININVTNVNCGPGHGFSIGSLGGSPNEKNVTGVTVRNCSLTGTLNGLRIKTWARPYSSACSDVTFEQINVNNVSNPIFIDQYYCPSGHCPQGDSMLKINGVRFRNVEGSSRSKIAVNLQCSKSTPCENIELSDINMVYNGDEGGAATSTCSNVQGVAFGQQNPPSCIPKPLNLVHNYFPHQKP